MRTSIKGKNLEVAAADRRYVEDKLRRLSRLTDDRSEALVELSRENPRSPSTSYVVDVTLVIDGQPVRGTARAASHHAAIDDVLDKIERQAVEHKQRPLVGRNVRPRPADETASEPDSADDGERPTVVKVKRFDIEPMFEEDAVSQMEELGHSFFVFVNAETERLAVLYRRRDGHYGMIEPQIGGVYTQADARKPAERRRPGGSAQQPPAGGLRS